MTNGGYHDRIIDIFCSEIDKFSDIIGFFPSSIERNRRLGPFGEIDIILYGPSGERALVEVKSHGGLMGKFLNKQLRTYHDYDSQASIFLLLGNRENPLDYRAFHLKKYWPSESS